MCAGEAGKVSELGNARAIRQASQDTIGAKCGRGGVRGRWGELNGQWGGDEARERCNEEREDELGKFGELRVSWDGDVWKEGWSMTR